MPSPPSKNGHGDLLARKLKRSLCLQDYRVNANSGAVVSKRGIGGTGWRPPLHTVNGDDSVSPTPTTQKEQLSGNCLSAESRSPMDIDANPKPTLRPRPSLPAWYGQVLHVDKAARLDLRVRMQVSGARVHGVKRGTLPSGWRPIVKMKKLLREWRKTEAFLTTANPQQALRLKRHGLMAADRVVCNLRCLESLLFTVLVEFEVKKAVWMISEQKTFQVATKSLHDAGGRGVGSAATARFQIMQHGRDYVVIDCCKPEEFDSFQHMLLEAGWLNNLVDEKALRSELKMDPHDAVEGVHLAQFCTRRGCDAAPVTGYSGFRIRKRIYPWVSAGMTDDIVLRNFQRLRHCIRVLENVWDRAGYWKHVLEPFPEGWTGARPAE